MAVGKILLSLFKLILVELDPFEMILIELTLDELTFIVFMVLGILHFIFFTSFFYHQYLLLPVSFPLPP